MDEKHKKLTSIAWKWLARRYDIDVDLDDLNMEFKFIDHDELSRPSCRVHYADFNDGSREFIKAEIRISVKDSWTTYEKKTAWAAAYRIKVPEKVSIVIQLVHELTHLIQWLEGRGMAEVETTRNEIMFAFEHYYAYFKKCKPLIDRRKLPDYGKRFRPLCLITKKGIKE